MEYARLSLRPREHFLTEVFVAVAVVITQAPEFSILENFEVDINQNFETWTRMTYARLTLSLESLYFDIVYV